jgi:hypothetical protein
MKLEIDEDERTLIVRALDQYHAYLVSQQREFIPVYGTHRERWRCFDHRGMLD